MRTFSRAVLAALAVLIFSPIFVSPSFAQGITAGDILVADRETGTIRRYSASGADPAPFASGLSAPWSITADQHGNIYVSERDGQRVKKFSSAGGDPVLTITTCPTITRCFTPGGVRVGTDGRIYVVDTSGGQLNRYSASDGTDLGSFPSTGTGLVSPNFMTFDAQGNLYVTGTDPVLGEVVRGFSPTGAPLVPDFVPGFSDLTGIAFDARGNFYVASFTSNIVQKYDPFGNADPIPFASGDFEDSFRGIAFDASGNLYVASSASRSGSGNILRFPPAAPPELFATGLGLPWDLVIVPVGINPTVKDECKEGDWQSFDTAFKNQGDCIQFVNTGK
jgi:sugar lactone lactonase YvrE